MTKAVENSTAKSDMPSGYAKLYCVKNEKEKPSLDFKSIFEAALPERKYLSELSVTSESQKFFENKRDFGQKLGAGIEAFFMSFISLASLITVVGGFVFNKMPDHIFEKTLKPLSIGMYALCFLFGYFAYNAGNKYNKKLDTLNNLYSLADRKEQEKADKTIKKLHEDYTTHGGLELFKNWEASEQIEKLIGTLSTNLQTTGLLAAKK